ncbi:unnamed protein product [Closterium sp. NIES-53]
MGHFPWRFVEEQGMDVVECGRSDLTVDLLEKHLLAAETSVVAVGAARGTPRTPFFERCSPSPLAPSYAFAAALDILGAEDVGAASALSGKLRSSKGKGGRSGGGGGGSGGGGGGGGGGSGGSGGRSGGFGGDICGSGGGGGGGDGSSGSGGGGTGGGRGGAIQRGGSCSVQRQQQQRRSETPSPQQLREWFAQRGASGGSVRCPYVIRMDDRAGQTCGKFHSQHRCFSRLDDAWRAEFGDKAECPRWAELLRSGPDPGIEAAALGASESALPGTAPAAALQPCQTLIGQGRECYFLLVVDDYTRYTTVFPLRSKGEVPDVLIPWIRAVRLQLRERFREDHPVLHLHSDRGGEFSSDLLRDFCRGEGILHSFTLPASPQKNGVVERRIGLIMEVPRTSMIHVAAPHFLWPFAVRYAAHQLHLWSHVSLPETSPTLRWTGKVGDALVFQVWGSCAFVCDSSADKLCSRAILCVFLGFPPDVPYWQFYHPTSRHVLPSQDVTFDGSVPFYRLFPYHTAPLPPPPPRSSLLQVPLR